MGNGVVSEGTADKLNDPLNLSNGKAGGWDPLGLVKKPEVESAADRAARLEMERQVTIGKTQGRINQVFDDPRRQGEIEDFVDAMRTYYRQDIDRQKGQTDRDLRFSMARSGLTGGSVQVDKTREFGEQYARSLTAADQKALGAGAQLSAQDQDARARLITLATSGLDATTAAQQASAAMRSGLESSRSAAKFDGMGDAFGTFKTYLNRSQEAADRRRANTDSGFGPYGAAPTNYGG